MMDCFMPVKPTKFELAIQEELPELYDNMRALLSETSLEKYFVNLHIVVGTLDELEEIYDKEGRVGLRKFGKTSIQGG